MNLKRASAAILVAMAGAAAIATVIDTYSFKAQTNASAVQYPLTHQAQLTSAAALIWPSDPFVVTSAALDPSIYAASRDPFGTRRIADTEGVSLDLE